MAPVGPAAGRREWNAGPEMALGGRAGIHSLGALGAPIIPSTGQHLCPSLPHAFPSREPTPPGRRSRCLGRVTQHSRAVTSAAPGTGRGMHQTPPDPLRHGSHEGRARRCERSKPRDLECQESPDFTEPFLPCVRTRRPSATESDGAGSPGIPGQKSNLAENLHLPALK